VFPVCFVRHSVGQFCRFQYKRLHAYLQEGPLFGHQFHLYYVGVHQQVGGRHHLLVRVQLHCGQNRPTVAVSALSSGPDGMQHTIHLCVQPHVLFDTHVHLLSIQQRHHVLYVGVHPGNHSQQIE